MRARRWVVGVVVVGALSCQGCLEVFGAGRPQAAQAINARRLARPCEAVWPVALHALTARGFRLMAGDPLNGVASFQWADERELGRLRATGDLEQFLIARRGFLTGAKDARIEAAVLELNAKAQGCEASLRVSYAGRSGAFNLKRGWIRLQSTGKFEESLLAAIAAHLGGAEPHQARRKTVRGARAIASLPAEPSIAGGLPPAVAQSSRKHPGTPYAPTQVVRLGVGH